MKLQYCQKPKNSQKYQEKYAELQLTHNHGN